MSEQKKRKITDRKQIQRVFNILVEAGYKTEKDILAMTAEEILNVTDKNEESRAVTALQRAIKKNKGVSFLAGLVEEGYEDGSL